MREVTDEIERAIDSLQLKARVIKLSRVEAETVTRSVIERYVGGKSRRWWWEAFPLSSESVSFDDGLGYQRISTLVPNALERCWFIVEGHESEQYHVYEACPEDASAIIGECFGFEYYVAPKDLSWIICENHHGRVIGCGSAVEVAIGNVAR